MAITERISVGIRAGVFDRVTECEKRVMGRRGQRIGGLGGRHHRDAGDFPAAVRVMPVDPQEDRRYTEFPGKPECDIAYVLLHPELVGMDAQPALPRDLQGASRPGFTRHGETVRAAR